MPPVSLPGLRPEWSRLVPIEDGDGITRTFHVLDSWGSGRPTAEPLGTVLAVMAIRPGAICGVGWSTRPRPVGESSLRTNWAWASQTGRNESAC